MSVPRGMVSSVLWSGVFGYLFLCAFVLMIPNMDDAAKQGWNVFFWAMGERVPETIRTALYVTIFISQWLCGLATVTSVSRMLFAFSRDDGIPGISKALAKVDAKHRAPVNAIWAGSTLAVLFVWFTSAITIAGAPAYSIVVSCTVIFLFLSFAVPIALALFTYGTSKFPAPGPWNLGGGLFRLVCVLSLVAMAIIFYAGIQPPNDWALPITVGFIVLSLVIWLLFENRRFKGPPIGEEIKRRQAEIKAAEAALGGAG
jgi:amino acid transporter